MDEDQQAQSHPVEVLWNHRQKREQDYMVPVLSASFRERPDGQGPGVDSTIELGCNIGSGFQGHRKEHDNSLSQGLKCQPELGCQIFRTVLAPEEVGGPSATENGQ